MLVNVIAAVLSILSGLTGDASNPAARPTADQLRPSGGMRLELYRVKGSTVRVVVFNGSSQIYWVNHSMLWNSPSAPKEMRDVDMEIRDSGGKRLTYDCRDYARPAVRPDYAVLYPNELVGAEIALSDCVNLRPGRYRVTAHFLDSNDVSGLVPAHPRFDQSLSSPVLELVVER